MELTKEESILEAILFVSGEAIELNRLALSLNLDVKTTNNLIHNLIDKYAQEKRGMQIINTNNSYQMCTNPEYFENIKILFENPQRKVLTQTLLETLAIIAYKQPITKGAIEKIRGVNADHAVNKLMEYNLICEKGRADTPGKPIIFGTTDEFLKYFGFENLNELPRLAENIEELKLEALEEINNNF